MIAAVRRLRRCTGQDYTASRASRGSRGTTPRPVTSGDRAGRRRVRPAGRAGRRAITERGREAAEAIALLALVAGQDVEPAEGSDGTDGRWRIARKVAPDRVISTVDPEARHAHKTRGAPPGRVQGPRGGRARHRADHRGAS